MSVAPSDLLVKLPLDGVEFMPAGDRVVDISGRGHHGLVRAAELLPDEQFGACLHFDGQQAYVALAGHAYDKTRPIAALTVAAWIRTTNQEPMSVISYGRHDYWHLALAGGRVAWATVDARGQADTLAGSQNVADGAWHFVVATYDGATGRKQAYVDGDLDAAVDAHGGFPLGSGRPRFGFIGVGSLATAVDGDREDGELFTGEMGLVAVYTRALSPMEVQRERNDTLAFQNAYSRSHALAFALYDDNDDYVLYIDANPVEGHTLNLELHNVSDRAIVATLGANGQAPQASVEAHHFELRFRPGTLSPQTVALLRTQPEKVMPDGDWRLFVPPTAGPGGTLSLYLRYAGADPLFLRPNQRRHLVLRHVSAAAERGSRGTRVEGVPHGLRYEGDGGAPITGARVQHLHVTDHRGRQNIPLRAGIAGSNRILNVGEVEDQELVIQLVNVMHPGSEHDAVPYIPLTEASRLIVSFDVELDAERPVAWALCTAGEAEGVTIEAHVDHADGSTPEIEAEPVDHGQGISRRWAIGPVASGEPELRLEPGNAIHITISGLESSLDNGSAQLYVDYEKIPGYWQGRFVLPVEKGPVSMVGQHVGIGRVPSTDSEVQLTLGGRLDIQTENNGNVRIGPRDGDWVHFHSDRSRFWFEKAVYVNGGNFGSFRSDLKLATYENANEQHTRLTIDRQSGNVGVGADPSAHGQLKLTVGGRVNIDTGDTGWVQIGPANSGWVHFHSDRDRFYFQKDVFVDGGAIGSYRSDLKLVTYENAGNQSTRLTIKRESGNVGIGTGDPQANLEIRATHPRLRLYSPSSSGKPALELVRLSTTFGSDTRADWRIENDGGTLRFERGRNNENAVRLEMDGSRSAFTGRVTIGDYEDITGRNNALNVRATSEFPAVWIGQRGEGDALFVDGRVEISNDAPGAALEINASATTAGGWNHAIRLHSSNHAAITHHSLLFGLHERNRTFYFGDIRGGTFRKYVMRINASTGETRIEGDLKVDERIWMRDPDDGKYYRLTIDTWDAGWSTSDLQLKRDVDHIPDPLASVSRLRGVRYAWNEQGLALLAGDVEGTVSAGPEATDAENQAVWQAEREKRIRRLSRPKLGLIAQEVEAVVPEAVRVDESGHRAIQYEQLVGLLVEAIKEQNGQIQHLQQRLAALETGRE